MPIFKIRGIEIDFPFTPYNIQRDYMEKVIDALENRFNAFLESPTGTGKTLSLLCASLGWLTAKKVLYDKLNNVDDLINNGSSSSSDIECLGGGHAINIMPVVIYTSRTHTQLTQAMQELKRTKYKNMKSVVLGSREQMCIHPEVEKLEDNSSKILICQSYIQNRTCHYYNRVENVKQKIIQESTVVDIEDLIKIGKEKRCCPYFMAKELKETADIVFMPYNYILTAKNRRLLGISLKNAIIIIDEAHNIERLCEESASSQIRSNEIAIAIREVTQLMDSYAMIDFEKLQKEFSEEDLMLIKTILLSFESILNDTLAENTFEGSYIFKILKEAGIYDQNISKIMSLLELMTTVLSLSGSNLNLLKGTGLQAFLEFLIIVKNSTINKNYSKEDVNECFKVHVSLEQKGSEFSQDSWQSQQTNKNIKVLSFWCFSPAFGMQMLMQSDLRSVILTSGTLAPLVPLINELQMNVKITLENDHVISNDQIFIKIISKGPDGEILSSNFQNRDNVKYISSLGTAISNYSRIIPGGLLIFFPSYTNLFKCTDQWKNTGMWSTIEQKKKIFMESKNKNSFQTSMSNYYNVVKSDKNGAIFMGVCRGKISEGLDFADINGRAVIITGLPYPPLMEPRVILKKEYLDSSTISKKSLSGQEWYNLEAIRAVNQAIGRVIRHKNDYGAILLMDSRFNNPFMISRLSKWLRDKIVPVKSFGESIRDLSLFFKNIHKYENIKVDEDTCTILMPSPLSCPKENTKRLKKLSASSSPSPSPSSTKITSPYFNQRKKSEVQQKKRFKLEFRDIITDENSPGTKNDLSNYFESAKKFLDEYSYDMLITSYDHYKLSENIKDLIKSLDSIFQKKAHLRFIIQGLIPFVYDCDRIALETYWEKMK